MANLSSGKLYVFEGVDAAGKSSLARDFHRQLTTNGTPASLLAFPGNMPGTLGELVYRIHHNSKENGIEELTPAALQALHIAAHLDAIERIIIPTLANGECVILDRFWWSTWAYGIVGGIQIDVLQALIEAECRAWGAWKPNCLFYIHRQAPLRPEQSEAWQKLKEAYSTLIQAEKAKYQISVIENELTPAETLECILSQTRLKQ